MDAPRARVARIARVAPHTIHTHTITQSPPRQPSRRRAARLGRSGAAEQRAVGSEAEQVGEAGPVAKPAILVRAPEPRLSAGGWQQQRRATSSMASRCRYEYGNDDGRLHQGKGSARALYTLQAGPALYKTGPVDCHRVPTSALRVGKTAFTSTTMWRMFAARTGGPRALARSRRRARAAATSRVTGPVLAASSTSEMHCRSQWSRSGLSECIHVAVVGHHLMPV